MARRLSAISATSAQPPPVAAEPLGALALRSPADGLPLAGLLFGPNLILALLLLHSILLAGTVGLILLPRGLLLAVVIGLPSGGFLPGGVLAALLLGVLLILL